MSNDRKEIVSYLMDNSIPVEDRLQVAYDIEGRFDCYDEFICVPHLIESLEEYGEANSLEYFHRELGWDWLELTGDYYTKKSDICRQLDSLFKRTVKSEVIDEVSEFLEDDHHSDSAENILTNFRKILNDYDQRIASRQLPTVEDYFEEDKEIDFAMHSYIDPVDQQMAYYEPGQISTIAGNPGEFKTTLALHTMYKNITDNNTNCVYITLEMPRKLIMYNLIARHTVNEQWQWRDAPVTYGEIRDRLKSNRAGEPNSDIEEHLLDTWYHLKNCDDYGDFEILTMQDFENLGVSAVRSRLSRLNFTPQGVFVDYMQFLQSANHPFSMRSISSSAVNPYVQFFSELSKDVDGMGNKCHVIMLSQVNRKGYKRACETEGRYQKSDLLGANRLERDSAQIYFTYASQELKDSGCTKVFLAKNREGPEMSDPEKIEVDASTIYVGGEVTFQKTGDEEDMRKLLPDDM